MTRYAIERVDWKDHRDEIGAVLARSFPGVPTARYAWLHERNPAGRAALWVARAAAGRIVGTAAVHPRRLLVDGQAYRAGQAADFAVDPAVRGFGPALALQRAVLAACASGEFPFLYGFPNRAARAVFERVGYRPGRTRRLARPLRLAAYLGRSRPAAALARWLALPLDLALPALSRETYARLPRGVRVDHVDRLDASFDVFWSRVRGAHPIVGDRDSEFMNWRYVEWPTKRYRLTVLRRDAELLGLVVSYRAGDIVYVADLLALDPPSLDGLLGAFLREQRRDGARAVSLILLGDAAFAARLARYHFFRRDVERALMLWIPAASPARERLTAADRWCLLEGDVL